MVDSKTRQESRKFESESTIVVLQQRTMVLWIASIVVRTIGRLPRRKFNNNRNEQQCQVMTVSGTRLSSKICDNDYEKFVLGEDEE